MKTEKQVDTKQIVVVGEDEGQRSAAPCAERVKVRTELKAGAVGGNGSFYP